VAICLGMGWLAVAAIPSLLHALPLASVLWLAAGGLLYTAGTPFYALDKRLPYAHGVWHLFVLGGAASHFLSVFLYVA
jgi:hemolysin III